MMYLRAGFSNKLDCQYSIFVSFQYNPNYVDLLKTIQIRSYNPTTKEWEFRYDDYSQLIGLLNQYGISYDGQKFMYSIQELQQEVAKIQERQQQNSDINSDILDEVEFKTQPFKYQLEGIAYGLNTDRFLNADEMGTGKTLQCMNIARLKRGGNHCLIIVGYDALQFNWVNEIKKHTDETCRVLGQQIKKNGRVVSGTVKQRYDDILNLDKLEEFFLIMSVTTLRQCTKTDYINKRGKKATAKEFYIADKLEEWCRKGEIGRIIFDECQVVRNYENDQTAAFLKLKSCPNKIAATGTPIMNENKDLYPIMCWLGYETRNFWEFRDRYCIMGGYKNKQVVGNKNTEELHKRLSQFMIRRKKSDVLDLPEKIVIDEVLEMDGKQWSMYEKAKNFAKAQLVQMKGNKVALLASLLNLRKITCNPEWVDETIKDSVKFERTLQLVYEIVQNNQKAIIFSNWSTPIYQLEKQLKHYNPVVITGDTKDRMLQVETFQENPECKVILGTIGAMGTGLTLTAANNVIFLDEPWNRSLKDQCIDRTHRPGAINNINIYTLMCRNTIDEKVHNTVYKKGRLADEIVDGITTEELENILTD